MLRDIVTGMQDVFDTEPPKGSIIIVSGVAGSLKSVFIQTLMSAHARQNPDQLVQYLTLEETRKSHIRNVSGFGLDIPQNMHIVDIATLRDDMKTGEEVDWCELIMSRVRGNNGVNGGAHNNAHDGAQAAKAPKLSCFALDSLNAFQALVDMDARSVRKSMQEIFFHLRERGITSFIVLETDESVHRPEYFMVDGIIELGMIQARGGIKRYLQVRKMRACSHRIDPFMVDIDKKGIVVKGEIIGGMK